MLERVRRELTGSTITNIAATNRAGEKHVMLFIEDVNGRMIRVCVPMREMEHVLNTSEPQPRRGMKSAA